VHHSIRMLIKLAMAGGLGLLILVWMDAAPISCKPRMAWVSTANAAEPDTGTNTLKVVSLTFGLLGETVPNDKPPPSFPKKLTAMEGARVRIMGFPLPYNDPENLTKLILIRTPVGCFYCNPPNMNAVVFVRRRPKDSSFKLDGQPVTFEGTLHLWRSDLKEDDDAFQFLFTIDNATVVATQPTSKP